jgi:small subunit ribosomal protein S17
VPEKKKATAKKTTATKTTAPRKRAAAGDVASGRASRPRRPAVKAGKAAASSERRLPSTSPAAAAAPHRGRRKTRVGRVAAAKTPKTVIVVIERLREHPLYKKVIKVRKRVPAHVADGEVKAGDLVRIQESRPFSATKRWQVIEVISRAGEAYAAAPESGDVERRLEETEGVTELLAKPEREIAEVSPEKASVALPEEDAEVGDGSGVRAKGANTKAEQP